MADKDEKQSPPAETPTKSDKEITIERIKEIGREVGRKHLPRSKRS